ncbi:MAG: virulence protein RhuM/Fic/DOC family protein [Desulfuromonadales bacterium]|nr:virulence protein RhuM/Fic/DOC family protein [Desulfuromonadales bacterium]
MNDVVIYQTDDGEAALEVHLDQETVWLSQAQMVDLFERDVSVVSRHIRNVFAEGELVKESNLQKMQIANSDRPVAFYSPNRPSKSPFTDGNKRIAAAIFIYFLSANGILYRPDGSKRLADNALVALTLLIAESRPEEKDIIVKVIVNLINRSND